MDDSADKDVLTILAQHEPFETYAGFLGSVIRCRICGEVTGRNALEALRKHDVAVLVTYGLLVATRPTASAVDQGDE